MLAFQAAVSGRLAQELHPRAPRARAAVNALKAADSVRDGHFSRRQLRLARVLAHTHAAAAPPAAIAEPRFAAPHTHSHIGHSPSFPFPWRMGYIALVSSLRWRQGGIGLAEMIAWFADHVHGALRCLALVAPDIDEAQLVPIIDNIFPELLRILSEPKVGLPAAHVCAQVCRGSFLCRQRSGLQQHSSTTRSKAVRVVTICTASIGMHTDGQGEAYTRLVRKP